MSSTSAELDKSGRTIQDMFGAVAPRYDLLNHLLSGALDMVWRRRSAAALADAGPEPVLDLCCGTGDQALALRKRGARVVAADFCVPMLALAERKYRRLDDRRPAGLAGDALRLPFAAAAFSGVTVSFGLRNVADLDAALAEMYRVLASGARLSLLEFAIPRPRPLRAAYLFYFRRILPRIGALLSPRGSAYTYLPTSVTDFPQRDDFVARLEAAGFSGCAWRDLAGGVVAHYTGSKP